MQRNKTYSLMAMAVLGVGTFAGMAGAQQQQQSTGRYEERTTTVTKDTRSADAAVASTPLALPPGTKAVDHASTGGMYRTLARATEDAISHNGFEDLVDRFTSADRDRLSKAAKEEKKDKELNDLVDRIQQDWKDKYHGRFSMDADKVFADAKTVEGDVTDPKALAAHWPVPAMSGMAMPAAAGGPAMSNEADLKKGYKVGIVRLPTVGTMSAMDVSLKREWLRWRIDVPDNRTAANIHDDLVKELTAFEHDKANWPADESEAFRHATHHVLMAVYGSEGMPARAG